MNDCAVVDPSVNNRRMVGNRMDPQQNRLVVFNLLTDLFQAPLSSVPQKLNFIFDQIEAEVHKPILHSFQVIFIKAEKRPGDKGNITKPFCTQNE